jgi:hypothetical protein
VRSAALREVYFASAAANGHELTSISGSNEFAESLGFRLRDGYDWMLDIVCFPAAPRPALDDDRHDERDQEDDRQGG